MIKGTYVKSNPGDISVPIFNVSVAW